MKIDVGLVVWATLITALFLRMVFVEPSFTLAGKLGCVLGVVAVYASFFHPTTYAIGILLAIFLAVACFRLTIVQEAYVHDEIIREFEKREREETPVS